MTLQLQLSDNTYPKEETGRGGLTGAALPCIWTSKTKELMELFQTPLLEGCLSLNRVNDRFSGTESHPAEKETRNKTVQRMISAAVCSLGWAIPQVSGGGRVTEWSTRDGWALPGIPGGIWCWTWHREARGAWQQGRLQAGRRAAGLHRTGSWSQPCPVSEIITGDHCSSSMALMNLSICTGW